MLILIILGMLSHDCLMQATGVEGVVAAQCRSLVKEYLPQLIKTIATMPHDHGHISEL